MNSQEPDIELDHEGVRALLRLPKVNAVHHLRRKGVIPCRRLHYRHIRYSKSEVLAAVANRTVQTS